MVSKATASADAASVSPDQVAAFRLDRHHLDTRASASTLAQVAGDMAGAQAQVISAAFMSLWARTRGVELDDVEKALWKDRTLVKVWCMRGSLHLVPSEEFAVFVRGSWRRESRLADYLARAGISMEPINRIVNAIPTVLDHPLTRKEIAARLAVDFKIRRKQKAGRGWGGPSDAEGFVVGGETLSVYWLVSVACMRGLACFGPMRGNEATFVRPRQWLPNWQDRTVEEAETALLRRYLEANGPATVSDFALWTYMKAADAREIWGRLEQELAPVNVDGRPGWLLRKDRASIERAGLERPSVRLLPFFDAFLLAHKDKKHLVDLAHYKRVYRPQGWLSPVVLVDGRVAGVWSHERSGPNLSVRVEAFHPFPAEVQRQVRAEANDLGRFLGAAGVDLRVVRKSRKT
jgi:uncharacterized protein YcaQ